MDRKELKERYFNWLYGLVFPWDRDQEDDPYGFQKLLRYLYSVEFYSPIEKDKNRIQDGVDLRYEFGWTFGFDDYEITVHLDDIPCTVLEMMVALARRCENQFMQDSEYGDRTNQWFRKMIMSLGLRGMYNINYNPSYVKMVIERFLNHDYEPNGTGGLFALKNPTKDMRTVEIWEQLCAYLNTIT